MLFESFGNIRLKSVSISILEQQADTAVRAAEAAPCAADTKLWAAKAVLGAILDGSPKGK